MYNLRELKQLDANSQQITANTTSKGIFKSWIWNSNQVKNTWEISPYIVDYQKAFDSVWHNALLYKVLDKFCHFIADRYSRSKCAIKIGNKRTHYFSYKKGVRWRMYPFPIVIQPTSRQYSTFTLHPNWTGRPNSSI